jgi:hypothetical protein
MQIALGVNKTGANHESEKEADSGKCETKKTGKTSGSSCSVVLMGLLVQSVPETVARPLEMSLSAVTAGRMLAELAALVSQRPQCRDLCPIHANVALALNKVALSLAYYCDQEHC